MCRWKSSCDEYLIGRGTGWKVKSMPHIHTCLYVHQESSRDLNTAIDMAQHKCQLLFVTVQPREPILLTATSPTGFWDCPQPCLLIKPLPPPMHLPFWSWILSGIMFPYLIRDVQLSFNSYNSCIPTNATQVLLQVCLYSGSSTCTSWYLCYCRIAALPLPTNHTTFSAQSQVRQVTGKIQL